MFVGGIIQFVDSLKQTDIPASGIAFGAARVFFSGISSVIVGIGLFFANAYLWVCIGDEQNKIGREESRDRRFR